MRALLAGVVLVAWAVFAAYGAPGSNSPVWVVLVLGAASDQTWRAAKRYRRLTR